MSLHSVLVIALLALSTPVSAQETSAFRVEPRPAAPGTAIGFAADMLRTRGGADLTDHSVGALISVRHPATVHQFAMASPPKPGRCRGRFPSSRASSRRW